MTASPSVSSILPTYPGSSSSISLTVGCLEEAGKEVKDIVQGTDCHAVAAALALGMFLFWEVVFFFAVVAFCDAEAVIVVERWDNSFSSSFLSQWTLVEVNSGTSFLFDVECS